MRYDNTIHSLLKEEDHYTSHILANTIILDFLEWRVSSIYIGFIHAIPWVVTMALSIPYIQDNGLITLFPSYMWSLA